MRLWVADSLRRLPVLGWLLGDSSDSKGGKPEQARGGLRRRGSDLFDRPSGEAELRRPPASARKSLDVACPHAWRLYSLLTGRASRTRLVYGLEGTPMYRVQYVRCKSGAHNRFSAENEDFQRMRQNDLITARASPDRGLKVCVLTPGPV